MSKSITIGIHSENVMSDDAKSLMNAFNALGVNAMSYNEAVANSVTPNLTIGFNLDGINHWQKLLNQNIPNILWSTDSVFVDNYNVLQQFSGYKNFILFNSTDADTQPVSTFVAKLTHGYLPVGVDTDFWCPSDKQRDIDITVLGNVCDVDSRITKLKETMPELVYNLMMDVVEVCLSNPVLSLYEVMLLFQKQMNFEFSDEQVILFMNELSSIVTTKLYQNALKELDGYSITFVGDDNWQKYKKETDRVVSFENNEQLKDLLQCSKIVFTIPEYSSMGGLDANILKSVACAAQVITPVTRVLKSEFEDTLCYFNPVTCEDLQDGVKKLLENTANGFSVDTKAKNIVLENQTWKNRAQAILNILEVK